MSRARKRRRAAPFSGTEIAPPTLSPDCRRFSPRRPLRPKLVDLSEAAREVIALSSSDLQRSQILLRSELANDLPPVIGGDRVQLQQVILNLLQNEAPTP